MIFRHIRNAGMHQKLLNKAENELFGIIFGALAQLGAHHTGSVGVTSSSLVCSTHYKK